MKIFQGLTFIIVSFLVLPYINEYIRKPQTYLKSSYYIYIFIASLGIIVYVILNASVFALDDSIPIKQLATSLFIWFHSHSMGGFHLLLAVNRCTALLWPMKFDQIWTTRNVIILLALVYLYPIVSNIPGKICKK